ncbi:Piso0_000260 [Millerozyma farinosa CBS 7064]|uniref:Piso0_000260 protein n=1 Tax=Pichia sorbitophila (strain ATCC MYA-4447 / BCRC 22081 / CBS 7064 / NBRC 10061 / NRRL Y-12695) TaxID=559304 RepID=G8YTI0_PICSO|nr:Piso0_000260 [Millerozyma farinosa CBS 7064]
MRKGGASQFSTKDKKYTQQIEKALGTFDLVHEWADYIAFLSRLSKALQLSNDSSSANTIGSNVLPKSVATKLSLCLSPKLPNGVHSKTLDIYESILRVLTPDGLSNELHIWLPGLLPVLSFCSIQIKPQITRIYRELLLEKIDPKSLQSVTKALLLSLFAGLDDEASEFFNETLELIDLLKTKLKNDSFFWQSVFLCIINNPEKRLGSLNWCTRRLPIFQSIKVGDTSKISDEAMACLTPESGLLVRAFIASLKTSTSFNSANDIIVIRGYFDLLLSHLSLGSDILNTVISKRDKDLLIFESTKVTLRKDMSLNRRLWSWLLGPELETISSEESQNSYRVQYFDRFGLEPLVSLLLKSFQEDSTRTEKVDAMKISTSLIMDRWELSKLIAPRVFLPILQSCYAVHLKALDEQYHKDLLKSSQAFFNVVEASNIWHDLIKLVTDGTEQNLKFFGYVLSNFDFNGDEMLQLHIPLAILTLLQNKSVVSKDWMFCLKTLMSLAPPNTFFISSKTKGPDKDGASLIEEIKNFYGELASGKELDFPLKSAEVSYLVISNFEDVMLSNLYEPRLSLEFSSLFCEQLMSIPCEDIQLPIHSSELKQKLLKVPVINESSTEEERQTNLLVSFSGATILNGVSGSFSATEKAVLLNRILSNFWVSLTSHNPANYQIETVKWIFDLQVSCSTFQISAGISKLLINADIDESIRAFTTLWTHSASSKDSPAILERPLQLILDKLLEDKNKQNLRLRYFLQHILQSGTSNRFLMLLTSPLLSFPFINGKSGIVGEDDDINLFHYYLELVYKILCCSDRRLKDAFANELAVIDNGDKLDAIIANGWDISSYKSLLICVVDKYLSLKLAPGVLGDKELLLQNYCCISSCLDLTKIIFTGNEVDFPEKFLSIINNCSYYLDLQQQNEYEIELTQCSYLACILHHLNTYSSLSLNTTWLHVEDDENTPFLVRFIVKGISKARSPFLLDTWVRLLVKSLYLFNESVFSVLFMFNDSLIQKIGDIFSKTKQNNFEDNLSDVESSISILLTGLEDLMSICHSYLITSKVKADTDKQTSSAVDTSFLGNVLQGIFQLESPDYRTLEQNKLYSVLLSFQDAVRVSFRIWTWADTKGYMTEFDFASVRSIEFVANKLKFKSKKLLDSLIEIERGEVIETIMDFDDDTTRRGKLLHILDGGRSQITIPYILNSITSRSYSVMSKEGKRSTLTTSLTSKKICEFLITYLDGSDTDSILDIWNSIVQFFKEVISHSSQFKNELPYLLKVLEALSLKIDVNKHHEQKKNKKDIAELFVKTLQTSLSTKAIITPDDTSSNKESSEAKEQENEEEKTDETLMYFESILMQLEEILNDNDKVTSCVNSIITHLISSKPKTKKVGEIPTSTLKLIQAIGKYQPVKNWKSLVSEIFTDSSFFDMPAYKLDYWKLTISIWIKSDEEKLQEFINKVTPSSSSSGNIFLWNDSSEILTNVLALRQISYCVIVSPKDTFVSYLDDLFTRGSYALDSSCPVSYRIEVLKLIRVITLKFSELQLLPYWTIIIQKLSDIFEEVSHKNAKELNSLSRNELDLLLGACKVLDQLLILRYDEFNLHDWLFVSSNSDIVEKGIKESLIATIDRIAIKIDYTPTKDPLINLHQSGNSIHPLLCGVKSVYSVTSLRLFFNSLSLINYERTFNLHSVDETKCIEDIINDLAT